jgi:argininosuccinate lyase
MTKDKQATWGGRFQGTPSERMIAFGESVSFDYRLAPYDIRGSKAHAAMLGSVGLLTEQEVAKIHSGLDQIAARIAAGTFEWDIVREDVHMNIEQALKELEPAAAKLHTARSRNDQVATDMHLYIKEACEQMITLLAGCMNGLLDHASEHLNTPAPSYTHLQRAQPITLAHYCLAWVEMLWRDIREFQDTWDRANVCPLGSGALAGTTLPIDREHTARTLGFVDSLGNPKVTTNSLDTVANRDTMLKFAFACSQCALHCSRLAEDWILWSTSEFRFIRLPDEYTTGSSLMPQKRNPDALELTRGKSARILGQFNTLLTLIKAQPMTYNRDMQEDKPALFDQHQQLAQILDLLCDLIPKVTFNLERLREASSDPMLYATDVADYLVEQGMPFREAHHVVGALVALAEKKSCPLNAIPMDEVKGISALLDEKYLQVFDFNRSMERRSGIGMPNPTRNTERIEHWRNTLNALQTKS